MWKKKKQIAILKKKSSISQYCLEEVEKAHIYTYAQRKKAEEKRQEEYPFPTHQTLLPYIRIVREKKNEERGWLCAHCK